MTLGAESGYFLGMARRFPPGKQMPRYFFNVTYSDQTEVHDPDGTALPNDLAAVQYVRRVTLPH